MSARAASLVERDVIEYDACVDYRPGPHNGSTATPTGLVQYMGRELRSSAERGIPAWRRPPGRLEGRAGTTFRPHFAAPIETN